MKVYTVQRTITIKVDEEVIAHSKREALEIADEVISFPMMKEDNCFVSTDKVIETRARIDENDGVYVGWESCSACASSTCSEGDECGRL